MNITLILSYLPPIIGLFAISLVVLISNSKKSVNVLFAKLLILLAGWLALLFTADAATDIDLSLQLVRMGLFLGSYIPLYFVLFAQSYSDDSSTNFSARTTLLLRSLSTAFALLSLTPAMISSVSKESGYTVPSEFTVLYTLQFMYTLLYFIIGIYVLKTTLKVSDNRIRSQIKLLLLGLLIAIIVNSVFGYLLADGPGILAGPASLVVFALFTGYSMIRHKLFDVRFLVVKAVTYLGTLVFAIIVPSVILLSILDTFIVGLSLSGRIGFFIVYMAISIIVAPTFKRFFDDLTRSIFYRDQYLSGEVLDELSSIAISNYEMDDLARGSLKLVCDAIKPSHAQLILLDADGQYYEDYTIRLDPGNSIATMIECLKLQSEQIVIVDEYGIGGEHETKQKIDGNLQRSMRSDDIMMSVRLVTSDELVGYLLFGPKRSGNIYTKQDIQFIGIAANEMSIAIQNARRFDEIKRFNETLKLEIERATSALRTSNEKLQALDQAKDEFVSMASHQLRTPLTSVKGYLSMVLEGDTGKVDKKQRELLAAAFSSSQRMVYLVSDLLNVSRLQTGKFVIAPVLTYLPDVVESEIEQLKETARMKKLTIKYKKPKKFPELYLDETKTRQVMMNFIDNAIYYTPSGGEIEVSLHANDKKIEYLVKDNGIGVPKSEQKSMFTKFYRASNAKKARPDGTGLGIFMAKKVIVDQGGAVIFNSKEGEGSTFGFTFPLTRVRPPKSLTKKPSAAAKKPKRKAAAKRRR